MLKTVSTAMRLLHILGEHPQGLNLPELAHEAAINKQAAFRLIKTLASSHMVSSDPVSRKLVLGAGLLRLAALVAPQLDLGRLATPVLTGLRNGTGETACLHMRFGDQRACVAQVESRDELRCVANVGELLPITTGAPGRVFLAFMPELDRQRLLAHATPKALTPHTVTDRARIAALVETARRDGFAMARDETVTGMAAVSAPVYDRNGGVAAAITVLGPSRRLTRQGLLDYSGPVCEAARALSLRLGYRPDGNETARARHLVASTPRTPAKPAPTTSKPVRRGVSPRIGQPKSEP